MAKAKDTPAAEGDITPAPDYLKTGFKWDEGTGEEFGGESEILGLEQDDVVGPLTLSAIRQNVDLGNNMGTVTMYEARDGEKNVWRLPIASSFRRQAENANLKPGDVFGIKRLPDAEKKHGKGKGNMMEMYAVKVITRGPAHAQSAV